MTQSPAEEKKRMPFNDKRDPNNWYNRLPVRDSAGGIHGPKTFTASQLKANEIQWGDATLAKIPQIPGRISRKNVKSGYGDRVTRYVELILEKGYDREKQQSRNKRRTIGIDISHIYDGMMIINKNYHKYFDREGNLIWRPEATEKHPDPDKQNTEAEQQSGAAPEPQPDPDVPDEPAAQKPEPDIPDEPTESVMNIDSNNQELNPEDEEIQQELNNQKREQDHLDFLGSMLYRYQEAIQEQAKKRPDKLLTVYQIRKINKVLKELKDYFETTDISDYLELAEEPEDGNPSETGMTYADMEILLYAYTTTLSDFRMGRLWLK